MSIFSGLVSIEDGVKAAEEYAQARKVRIELSFAVAEGQEDVPFLERAADIANKKVAELLGRAVSAPVIVKVTPAAEKPKRGAAKDKSTPPAELSDKEKLAVQAGVVETPAPIVDEDDLSDLIGETPKPPVTDAELAKAAQTTAARLKAAAEKATPPTTWSPAALRKLIKDYNPPEEAAPAVQKIPAAKRHDFLEALEALKR